MCINLLQRKIKLISAHHRWKEVTNTMKKDGGCIRKQEPSYDKLVIDILPFEWNLSYANRFMREECFIRWEERKETKASKTSSKSHLSTHLSEINICKKHCQSVFCWIIKQENTLNKGICILKNVCIHVLLPLY